MQKRFVSIWFPHLATDWHVAKQPQLRQQSFVLKTSSHNRVVITASSPLARAQGIHAGMALADAKAVQPSLLALDDKPQLTGQLLQRIAEWCIRFTPVASPAAPDGIILDATGCAHLWGGEEAYLNDIIKRLAAKGYAARAAMADTIGCAYAIARHGKDSPVIESGGQQKALSPLPVSSLRIDEQALVRLHKLGLRKIGDVLTLPSSSLRRRFGLPLLQRLQQALGKEEEQLIPVYPVEPYRERLPCLEPIVSLTGIGIALERLLHSLCNRLRSEGKGIRTAVFRCYRIDGGAQGIEIGTSRSSQNGEHLFHLFSLRLSSIEPKEGIELFVLEATKIEDYKAAQEQLWDKGGNLNNPQIAELIDRLAAKVGGDAIRRYLPAEHWWPERSFKRAASLNDEPTTAWRVDRPRPLQLLLSPESIEVAAPIPDYPPLNFRYKGKLHIVVKADGPERIEQEWWIQQGEHRDYYCVEDEEGCRYWLFRLGHYNEVAKPQWFLHGFFP